VRFGTLALARGQGARAWRECAIRVATCMKQEWPPRGVLHERFPEKRAHVDALGMEPVQTVGIRDDARPAIC